MKRNSLKWIWVFFLFIISACQKQYDSITTIDERNIQSYLQSNNLAMQQYKNTGVYYQILDVGAVSTPTMQYSDRVPLILMLRSLDNTYSSLDTFSANNRYSNFLGYFKPDSLRSVVKEMLKNRNGSIRVIVPSRFAYGKNGNSGIPENASLDYTVKTLDENKLAQYDDISINKYLTANSLTGYTKSTSGIYYKITSPGSSASITSTSTVTVEYTGKLFNGSIFSQATPGSGVSFKLNTTLKAWQEILPLLQQGGEVRLILPSALGYGLPDKINVYAPSTTVPAFSCLDFTIKVTTVTN